VPTVTKIKRNDTAPAFTATLLDSSGTPVNLSGAAARFLMRNPRTRQIKVDAAATIVDAAAGKVRYDWAVGDTNRAAVYQVEIQITFSDSTVETFPNGSFHRLEVIKDLGPAG